MDLDGSAGLDLFEITRLKRKGNKGDRELWREINSQTVLSNKCSLLSSDSTRPYKTETNTTTSKLTCFDSCAAANP